MDHGHLQGEVAHGAPGHAVAQAGLEPAQEAGPPGEGLGVLHRLVRACCAPGSAAKPPMPRALRSDSASTARPKKVMARTRPATMVNADEGQPDAGQGRAQQEEGELGPHPFGERLVQSGARQPPSRIGLLLGHGERQLASADAHPDAAVLAARPASPGRRHASRRVQHERPQAERGGAVGDHEHDPDCDRDRVALPHDGRHGVGEDQLRGETGDALRDGVEAGWAPATCTRRRPRWRRPCGGSRCRCPARAARRGPGRPPRGRPPAARPAGRASPSARPPESTA